jgi:hypothetical protein
MVCIPLIISISIIRLPASLLLFFPSLKSSLPSLLLVPAQIRSLPDHSLLDILPFMHNSRSTQSFRVMHSSIAALVSFVAVVSANSNTASQEGPFANSTASVVPSGTGTGIPPGTGTPVPLSSSNGTQAPPSPGGVAFTAHPDGQCQKQLTGTANNRFALDPRQGFPSYTTISKPSFPGAEAATGGGGWSVWWNIPQPPSGCRYQVMLPYRQSSSMAGYPGGNEIINVGREGCYFGSIPTDSDVLLASCCGSADCQRASLNSTSLLSTPQRREVRPRRVKTRASPAPGPALGTEIGNAARKALGTGLERRDPPKMTAGGSAAAKAGALLARFWYDPPPPPPPAPTCKVVQPAQPFSRAGPQVVISSSQTCTQTPCAIQLQYQISYATTATSSKDTTITTSAGGSVAVKAGVDFLAEGEVTTTLTTDFSRAVSEATGHDIMQGNSSSVSNNIAISLGNRGVVTFTPVYRCVTGPMDCGGGPSAPIDFCQPDLSGLGGSPAGDYYPLVSD